MAKPRMDLSAFVGKLLEEQDGMSCGKGFAFSPKPSWKPRSAGLIGADRHERSGVARGHDPIENKRNFLDVSADILEHDPIFYGDPETAAMKVLELS